MTIPVSDITAFAGARLIARGSLTEVALAAKGVLDAGEMAPVLLFDELAHPVEVDFRGHPDDVAGRLGKPAASEEAPARGPGRPKLGVVAREVTLLPRHWEWLSTQSGGASVTLRRLVDAARRSSEAGDKVRLAQEAAFRFMTALGGNEAEFDEVIRALFAGDEARFDTLLAAWPKDVAAETRRRAAPAFATTRTA